MTGPREPAGAVRARLVAALTGRLPELRPAAAGEVLERAGAGAGTAMRTVDAYLTATPDTFTVAVTECPAAYLRLVQALLTAGHDVTVPACADCGKQATGLRSKDRVRYCHRCYARRGTVLCARCGVSGRVAARRPEGVICYACYSRDPLVTEPCAACGKVRVPAARQPDGHPLCEACYQRPEQACSKCGTLARVKARTDDGPLCRQCYTRYQRPRRVCGRCGRTRLIAQRATADTPDVCVSCCQGVTGTCTVCGRVRPCSGTRSGKLVCQSCRPRQKRPCCRCGRTRPVNAEWPIGPVCTACYEHIRNHPATCTQCGRLHPLIGADPGGQGICGSCAGTDTDYNCRRCGYPGKIYAARTCARCVLTDRVVDLLRPAGAPSVVAQLKPLRDALIAVEHPVTMLRWLGQAPSARLLAQLAVQNNPLTHRMLDELPPGASLNHLRQTLVHTGVLDERAEPIERFGPWLDQALGDVPPHHASVIRPFAQWQVLRRARRRVDRRPFTAAGAGASARATITTVMTFLTWLDQRGQTLGTLRQREVDDWLTDGPQRHEIRPFLRWTSERGLTAVIEVPARPAHAQTSPVMTDAELCEQLRRCRTDTALPIDVRAAGALVTLYAIPLTRLVYMTTEHLTRTGSDTYLTINRTAVILPPAVAGLLEESAGVRSRSALGRTAPGRQWLFPGASPGRPTSAGTIGKHLRDHGIHASATHNAALAALAADMPASVVASLLGVDITTALRWARLARRDWTAYIEARTKSDSVLYQVLTHRFSCDGCRLRRRPSGPVRWRPSATGSSSVSPRTAGVSIWRFRIAELSGSAVLAALAGMRWAVRDRRSLYSGLVAGLLVLLGITIAIPVNVISGYLPSAVTGHRPLWIGVAGGGISVIVVLTLLSQRLAHRTADAAFWQVPQVTAWEDRPELTELVTALTAADGRTVALTTGLVGAGGFGKTMLAARACRERAVRRRFRGGIVWVTVGRDVSGAELAARISDVIRSISGEGATFTSPEQAGYSLARALAPRPPTLVVADDVWTASQLEPFLASALPGTLLVTTRRAAILDRTDSRRIEVDAVTAHVAQRLLSRNLPPMQTRRELELLDLTGGWPLLLSLVNRRLARDLRCGGVIETAAADVIRTLQSAGPTALDVADPADRQAAVAATINYSLDTLQARDRHRFLELGILAEDARVPLAVVALLWKGTAGLSRLAAQALCERLDGLSLLSLSWDGEMRVMVLHDVIRDFAAGHLGPARCTAAHAALVSAARPEAVPALSVEQAGTGGGLVAGGTAWWRLPETAECGYLWQHLTYHLAAALLEPELDQVCCDLRFLAIRLRRSGPAAVEADVARSAATASGQLRHVIAQYSHLLGPIEPASALITTLTSRLGIIPEMAAQLPSLRAELHAWTAWPTWPPPDEASDGLIRTLTGHQAGVTTVAISSDGAWLASGSDDKTARIWEADGTPRATLTGHEGPVTTVAISPDGTWLATSGTDATIRIWEADGTPRATLTGHEGPVTTVAISPDGTWLASGSDDKTARIWEADGTIRAVLTGHRCPVRAVAISPDGTWLATGDDEKRVLLRSPDGTIRMAIGGQPATVRAVAIAPDGCWLVNTSGTVRIWEADGTLRAALSGDIDVPDGTPGDVLRGTETGIVRTWGADGSPRVTLAGDKNWVRAVAISPDGTWLATSGAGMVRIWSADGAASSTLSRDIYPADAVAISPDGTWLVTVISAVRIWAADGTSRSAFTGHQAPVTAVAISPDSTWLATSSDDKTVRIWAADGVSRTATADNRYSVDAMAVSPDGGWLVTVGAHNPSMIWAGDGTLRATLSNRIYSSRAVAISPDGTWFAIISGDEIDIWAADGTLRTTFIHRHGWGAMAISPDGRWLATGGRTVKIWTADGTDRVTFASDQPPITALAISPDGTWLATGHEDGTVRTWAAADGTLRATMTGHADWVRAVAISPDGTWLATGGRDETARIWSADGTPRATLNGHRGWVTTVAISPDGAWLATGGNDDGTARIWSSAECSCVTALRVESTVTVCAWLPGGGDIYIGGDRGIYRFSLLPPCG